MKILITLLAIFGATYGLYEQFDSEVCRLFADGIKLRDPGDCASYLTCQDGVGTVTNCPKGYSKDKQECSTSAATDAYCKDPCTSKSPTWVADPTSCSGYYKCVSGKGTIGSCTNGLHFNEDEQACVYTSDSICQGYDICNVAPASIPFKNENSCHSYYKCVSSKLTEEFCEDGYYHARYGCIKRSEVECDDHPLPNTICGTGKKPLRGFIDDRRSCRGYYFCKDMGDNIPDLEPTWGQCAEGRFFGADDQSCHQPTAVKCEHDSCEGRNRSKVISGTLGCQHFFNCVDNKTVNEEICPDGLYFNDDSMECTSSLVQYDACS